MTDVKRNGRWFSRTVHGTLDTTTASRPTPDQTCLDHGSTLAAYAAVCTCCLRQQCWRMGREVTPQPKHAAKVLMQVIRLSPSAAYVRHFRYAKTG